MYIKRDTRNDIHALVRKLSNSANSSEPAPTMYHTTIREIIDLHLGMASEFASRDELIDRIARKIVQAGDDLVVRDLWETLALYLPDFQRAASQVRALVRESQKFSEEIARYTATARAASE